jgi:hypothetical protein
MKHCIISAAVVLVGIFSLPFLATAASRTLPDQSITPGVIDERLSNTDVCGHNWTAGNPPEKGGALTYSRAARQTSARLKDEVFRRYGILNPHDKGISYEVDHRVPLSLGGRDLIENLWPETRDRSVPDNAWVKDKLEAKLYHLVCHTKRGQLALSLKVAQAAFLRDWRAAYRKYCPTNEAC